MHQANCQRQSVWQNGASYRRNWPSFTLPATSDPEAVVELLQVIGRIWNAAMLRERRKIVHILIQTVYLDA